MARILHGTTPSSDSRPNGMATARRQDRRDASSPSASPVADGLLASARIRVLGVFVALTLLLLAGLILWQVQEARRTTTLLRSLTDESGDAVTRIIELDGRTLQQFVADYSPWDDMVSFVQTGDPAWARTNLVAVQSNYQADTLWVYSPEKKRVFGWASSPLHKRGLDKLAPPPTAFARLDDVRQLHYYTPVSGGGVLEVRAATIHPGDDLERSGLPKGYFFAGRLWDDRAIKQIEPLTGFQVKLLDREALNSEEAEDAAGDANGDRTSGASGYDDTTIRLRYRLLGIDGQTVGAFAFARSSPSAAESLRASRRVIAYAAVADALTITLLFWALHAYITAPLSSVAGYLSNPSPHWLKRLARAGTEFQHIGRMLEALARSQEERAALSAILSEVSRPLSRRDVLEAFTRGVATRLKVPAAVVLLPPDPTDTSISEAIAEGDATDLRIPSFASSPTDQATSSLPMRCAATWGLAEGLGEKIAAAYAEEQAARRVAVAPADPSVLTASTEGLPAPPGMALVPDDPALMAAGLSKARPELVARRIVPLVASGALRGVAVLLFGTEEAGGGDALYGALGSGVAVALQNARLFEEVRESAHALQVLSHRLVEVQEQERAHLARELHDEIGQLLTGLRLTMALAEKAPTEEERRSRREEIRSILADLTQRVRTMSVDLRPPQLDDFGLSAAVSWLTQRFMDRTGIEVALSVDPELEERRYGAAVETAAYRIIQEGLTNIARHSGAQDASVHLWVERAGGRFSLCLELEDNGAGFTWDGRGAAQKAEPTPTGGGLDGPGDSWAGGGSGLLGMRERAELLGGRFIIATAPGKGTNITVSLPLASNLQQ